MGLDRKSLTIIVTLLAVTLIVWAQGPIPQHVGYHDFADTKPWLGVPNGFNVFSNIPFFVAGVYGIQVLTPGAHSNQEAFLDRKHRAAYWVLFVSTCFVALGSSYYHVWPTMETLFCDRLPMTIAFMSIVTILLTEKVNARLGPRTLVPFIAVGVFSVFWWLFTELHPERTGDLRLYIVVQCAPVLLTPILVGFYPDQYTHTGFMHLTTGLYVAAKIAELLDHQIYRWTAEVVSGHSLKHLIAAVGPMMLARMLQVRKPTLAS